MSRLYCRRRSAELDKTVEQYKTINQTHGVPYLMTVSTSSYLISNPYCRLVSIKNRVLTSSGDSGNVVIGLASVPPHGGAFVKHPSSP